MKNKKTKSILVLTMIVAAILCAMALTSCSLFGEDANVVPVTVESITVLKTASDFTSSVEYQFNKDKNNKMALLKGEDFYLQITYNNPNKYAISSVSVTPEGENVRKIMSGEFDKKSSKTKTVIRFSLDAGNTSNQEFNYEIKKIYYVTGNETKAIKFDEEIKDKLQFGVVVNPTYTMTLDYENTDRRSTSTKTSDDKVTTPGVAYGTEMNTVGVLSRDYTEPDSRPTKNGGWKFEGWYTEPHGEGLYIQSTDTYFFWGNVTLYAHYSRLFDYTIVDLDEPLIHEYSRVVDGRAEHFSMTFTQAAVITKDESGGKYPYMEIYDTIADETVTESGYVTATEYPVIRVEKEAFKDVNNITTLRIGQYVESIEYGAFNNCNALSKVTFGEDGTTRDGKSRLKYIGDFAFQNTKKMGVTSAFTLPETVEYIGNFCFRYSTWSNTTNEGTNESVLHIYPRYKFIGVAAFFDTGFSKVVFEPGCHYESQIPRKEAEELEAASAWKTIDPTLNRIGYNLFGCGRQLEEVEIKSDSPEGNAINIIPDRCFDAGNYKNMSYLKRVMFDEGLEFIGAEAFNYQEKLTYLDLPASLVEIGKSAFYNNIEVVELIFREGSQLGVLHRRCFGNLKSIDRVELIMTNVLRYGDGPFEGCGRLKSIEFPNINDVSMLPQPFTFEESSEEVNTTSHHYYADLMFGTFQTGSDSGEESEDDDQQTSSYALPTRLFCKSGGETNAILNAFRDTIIRGKDTFYRSQGRLDIYHSGQYNNVVFVHDIDLIKTYENPTAQPGEAVEVSIALQEVYDANSRAQIGYSIVFWSERSTVITLPSSFPGLKGNNTIIEISMYALPTSVTEVTIPSTITRLEHDAFNGCVNLEKVNFENRDTLTYIGDYAFFGTKISEFQGGTSLKVIGENAFMRCMSLQWVDLMNTAITNPFKDGKMNPRIIRVQQYKYEYELKDDDNKDRTDHYDVLYDGAFKGCKNLRWAALPLGLKQVPQALFSNCKRLTTVIIPCKGVSTSNKPTDDDSFYYRALPTAIYDTDAVPFMEIFIPGSELSTHQMIFSTTYGVKYTLLSDDNSNIPPKE